MTLSNLVIQEELTENDKILEQILETDDYKLCHFIVDQVGESALDLSRPSLKLIGSVLSGVNTKLQDHLVL
jgi:hypothetical protein